jgi:photosystem II stability/assembly factor-like uncharacterized protein
MKSRICLLALSLSLSLTVATSAADLTGKLQWRSVGPTIGGRVVSVTGVPGDPNLFYMGGVDGGVWRSTDAGTKWENLTDGKLAGSNSIGAISVAPSNHNVIYVGTGESDLRGDVVTGDGVFKSTDAGKTWKYAGLRDTHTITGIVVDPKNPDVVYASSMGHVFAPNPDRGVFKSVDGGKSWRKVLYPNAQTGAIDLVMDPSNARVLYVTTWQAIRYPWALIDGGSGSGLYKSVDGGAHWTNLTHAKGFPIGTLGRIGVSVAASSPNVVYVIAQAKAGGIFRSNDGGASWTRVNASMELRQRAFYYMALFVDPTNANIVYVPQVLALWVSHNGAKSFTKLRTPHGDNHIVWIDPRDPRVLLEGNDGGATVSVDSGKSWSSEHNQPTGQFYHVDLDDQFPFHVYGAQQDEGSMEGPSAGRDGVWKNVAYGESTFVVPQPGAPNITFGSGYFSIFLRNDRTTGEYSSVGPWPLYQEGASAGEMRYRFGWTHPIQFSAANPKELLIAAQVILKSDDYGQTWTTISPDLTRNDPSTERPSGGPVDLDQSSAEIFPDVSALAVAPTDANVIWAGSADGLVHVTTDGGANWRAVTPPALPQWCEITSIEPSHTDKATAYLTASRYMWDDFRPYVYETADYGAHWTLRTTGLPDDQYVFAIRIDPNDANLLFVGTKDSVYASYDAGAHWHSLALNLPRVQVRDIAIDPREGEVVVATHGRSFWALDNLSLLEQLTFSQARGVRLFAPQGAWLTQAYGFSPPFGASVFFNIPKTYNAKVPVTLTFLDAQGNTIRTVTLHRGKKPAKPTEATEIFQPTHDAMLAQQAATAIEPGMNVYQWDLRYPDAVEVTGFNPPVAAGGLDDGVGGATVVPGTYTVVLSYGGVTQRQTFTVTLDPRETAMPDDLNARFALESKIHSSLDALDRTVNDAIAARTRLSGRKAAPAIAALDRAIDNAADLHIQSSEGSLLYETKLRDHLAYLLAEVDLSYTRPTAAEYAVFDSLTTQTQDAQTQLRSAIAQATKP